MEMAPGARLILVLSFFSKYSGRAVLWLLIASLASPAVAVETGEEAAEPPWSLGLAKSGGWSLWRRFFGRVSGSEPPWAVEAPGGAGARYGLGLDLFFEHQESLRISFNEQTLQTRDLLTRTEESGVVRTDPGLLNRKFDIRWDLAGAGIQPAVALPLPRTLGLYPTLVFQTAAADVSLDFHDRNRPADSSSLDGRVPLFGTGLDVTRSLCRSCPWFAGASYHFQRLPSFTVDRSPTFSPLDFEVLQDEVRLSRDVHDASTRVGYGFSGNRIVSYLGVSHRWTDVEIEDRLRYREPFREVETSLSSRTRLESEATLALAGVEARLGPRLFGRMETSVGGGDWGVLFRVVYIGRRGGQHDDDLETVRRLEAIAAEIAQPIAEIEALFLAGWKNLTVVVGPDGQPAYLVRELEELLRRTERDILDVLNRYTELEALADWVQDEFRRARILGGLEAGSITTANPAVTFPGTETIVATLGLPHLSGYGKDSQRTQAGGAAINKPGGDNTAGAYRQTQEKLKRAILMRLHLQFNFVTTRKEGGSLKIFPRRRKPEKGRVLAPGGRQVGVGIYSWIFYDYKANKLFDCNGNTPLPPGECPLDLIDKPCVIVTCSTYCKLDICP